MIPGRKKFVLCFIMQKRNYYGYGFQHRVSQAVGANNATGKEVYAKVSKRDYTSGSQTFEKILLCGPLSIFSTTLGPM